ncbi:unnamed protein product [Ectocarpus sp. CCAP 1310/34]|nr:unnamed protein product [Ectocarpus sp. CCAP 1310/34]
MWCNGLAGKVAEAEAAAVAREQAKREDAEREAEHEAALAAAARKREEEREAALAAAARKQEEERAAALAAARKQEEDRIAEQAEREATTSTKGKGREVAATPEFSVTLGSPAGGEDGASTAAAATGPPVQPLHALPVFLEGTRTTVGRRLLRQRARMTIGVTKVRRPRAGRPTTAAPTILREGAAPEMAGGGKPRGHSLPGLRRRAATAGARARMQNVTSAPSFRPGVVAAGAETIVRATRLRLGVAAVGARTGAGATAGRPALTAVAADQGDGSQATDDAGLPLSSTGARARQEALDAADAAAAEADTIRIQDKMDKLKPEQLDSVTRLPLGPDPDEFSRFAPSCKGVVTEILKKSDVKRKQTFKSSTSVTGWLPLFVVENRLRKEPAGPLTYAFFIQKLAAAWDTEDKSSGIDRLRGFGVSNGETYGEYIRRCKALAMSVIVSHHAFKPSDAQVQIAVRDSMLKQCPVVSGQVYKDEQLSMEAPFGRHASCLDDM